MVNDNYIHFMNQPCKIDIYGLKEIAKGLNRIADELEKANNKNCKHSSDNKTE